jgi:hypothetical protein
VRTAPDSFVIVARGTGDIRHFAIIDSVTGFLFAEFAKIEEAEEWARSREESAGG